MLEGELQSQLDYSLTAFGRDLTEVLYGVSGKRARARNNRIVTCSSDAVRKSLRELLDNSPIRQRQILVDERPFARRIQRQVDVAVAGVLVINILRECLIEDIEEPCAELNVLALPDLEVLEQGDVPIRPIRRAEVERRDRRPGLAEGRNAYRAQIEHALADVLPALVRVLGI